MSSVVWERFFDALRALPAEIEVLGINDYFSIEGYRRVRDEWMNGRIANIKLVMPVVEVRLDHLAGNTDTQRVNFHILFSPDIIPETIDRDFLTRLTATHAEFRGTIGRGDGMAAYGRAVRDGIPVEHQPRGSDERVGFEHAFISLGAIESALRDNSVFAGKTLTAIGYNEWASMRWSGGGGIVKKNLAAAADFFLGASAAPTTHYLHVAALDEAGVPHRLLDASDAHRFADDAAEDRRLGHTMTWIRADATFEGLRRALQRYDERIFVGDEPDQRRLWRAEPHRFIRSVSLHKRPESTLAETWFDNDIELNHGLVAIIGNQGSGKSALTDALALGANAETQDFSFLTEDRFRKPRHKKATHFTVRVEWEDGKHQERGLEEGRDPTFPERARYVPQQFFDLATNEVEFGEGGKLYDELERAVFSHIPPAQRQGCLRFRQLVGIRTGAIDATISTLRAQLATLNTQIGQLEEETADSAREAVRGRFMERSRLIEEHAHAPPTVLPAPDHAEDSAIGPLRARVLERQALLANAATLEAQLFTKRQILAELSRHVRVIRDNAVQQRDDAIARAGAAIEGTVADDILTIVVNTASLGARIATLDSEIQPLRAMQLATDPTTSAGLLEADIRELDQRTRALGDAQRQYEMYRTDRDRWERRLQLLHDDPEDSNALNAVNVELHRVEVLIPETLVRHRTERAELSNNIHAQLTAKLAVYSELANHVQEYLSNEELTRDHYRLEFDLGLSCVDLVDQFFALIKHQGPFAGADAAKQWARNEIDCCDFSSAAAVLTLISRFVDKVSAGAEDDAAIWDAAKDLLRQGRTLTQLYDSLYGQTFIRPRYRLGLSGRPLEQLSPGERGILLLIFYLIVDRSDLPLIIDQPEGNLNNQSIYQELVPVFRKAKQSRQIIMVSHNPNMVVGCDADQIIHAQIDHANGFRVSYTTGALENPIYREFTVEKLEGTRPAFSEREEAYIE